MAKYRYEIIDDILDRETCQKFVNMINKLTYEAEGCNCPKHEIQTIKEMPKVANYVWNRIKEDLSNLNYVKRDGKKYKLMGLSDAVTVSRHNTPIGIHRDVEGKSSFRGQPETDLVCLYKMAVYLNDVGSGAGGTILYDDNRKKYAEAIPAIGRSLIFDIRALHSGAPIPKRKVKYLIGFRLLYCEL